MTAHRPAALLFLRSLIFAVGYFGAVVSVQAAPVVSNLTAAQRAGTKLVDISYDLAAPGFGSVAVTLEASSDGGATWTVPVASATGAVGGSVTPGTGKAIVWNAGVDWLGNYSTQMRFRVVAEDGFSYIPGGSFAMGRTSGDTDADAPPITVTVSPFYIQQTETTKAQWDEVRTWGLSNGYSDLASGGGKASNHPVHSVNWWDVVKWCNARSEKEGLTPVYTVSGTVMRTGTTEPTANWSANGYRLPTEAEWEKAARGGVSGKRFPWGTDTISHMEANYTVYSQNGTTNFYSYDVEPRPPATGTNYYHPSYTGGGTPYTNPAGSFSGNGFGLEGMAGNIWEWCWDWYGSTYYTASNGTTDPRGATTGTNRVGRGGVWNDPAAYLRCANRGIAAPGNVDTRRGFRPARTHLVEDMSLIPGGSFTMGRTSGDTDADAPSITVTLSPFYIQQTETTKAQWDEVRTWGLSNGYTDLAAGAGKASNHPVQTMSWWDVVKWCNARSEKEGLTPVYTVGGAVMRTGTTQPTANWSASGYRLPTEAEWEKAARGGVSGKRFPWATDTISHAQANFRNFGGEAYVSGTPDYHPSYNDSVTPYTSQVGSFGANGYGLYDMTGNVWEWCWDRYGSDYYSTSNGTSDPRGPASGSGRVGRGGSWNNRAVDSRCSVRFNLFTSGLTAGNDFGFRPARSVTLDAMVPIPGGSFTMGRTSGDTDADAPSITVTISPFYLQQTETTKAQWDEVRTWGLSNGYTDLPTGGGKAANHPVQSVDWWDVVKWCNARSEKEGLTPVYTVSAAVMRTGMAEPTANWSANGYRLPTEAEWEKAARGGVSGKRFPWGTDTISHSQANYYGSSSYAYDLSPINNYHPTYATGGFPYTSPTGSFSANGFGLYDMAGNACEWCWDYYGASSYLNGVTDPRGAAEGVNRVARGGGCWNDPAIYCRAAFRGNRTPDSSYNSDLGLRPARSFVGGNLQPINITVDTRELPNMTTSTASSITSVGVTLGGNVTSDGGASITERGVVYSGTANNADPLIGGLGVTKVTSSGTTGVFTVLITGLTPGINYSYKAYATNSQGTTYTSIATFTTLSNNADLSALTLSSGTLDPTFASATTSYTASVPNATTSITVTPTRAQANATIEARVNTGTYAAVTSGSASDALSLNVGTNTVDVRVTAQDGTTQKTYTVTVTRDKAAQTITFANPGAQLANATVNLSATGGASGNPVTFAVEGPATRGVGNVLSFTGAGSVTVRANQAGNGLYHPAPEVAQTFTVAKATATVTLGNLSQTYDGTPRPVTASTNPSGKSVVLTYDDSPTPPTEAGFYAVVGMINDPIYQGSVSRTLVIAKAAQTITFAAIPDKLTTDTITLAATGGGSGNPVTFAVTNGPASITDEVLSFTGAGNVTITVSQAGNANYDAASSVSRTFAVTKATATVTLGNLSQTYDGTPKSATATTDPAGKTVNLTYDGGATAPTNAASYVVVGTINDPIYQGSATGTLSIAKAAQAITFAAIPDKLTTDTITLSATGGGSGNPVTFAVTEGPATISGGVLSFTGSGNVIVTASQKGNANYDAASTVSRTFTVTKATATVTLGNLSQTYDGTSKSAAATTDPAGKTVTFTYAGSATAPTSAGTYAVVGTIDDGIYQGSANGTLTIAKAAQTITFANPGPQLANATVTLSATGGGSGNPVTFAVTSGPASITNGVLNFTGPGSVTITASQAGNANYEAASPVSRTFTVSKAAATITLSRLHQVADGSAREIVVTTVPADLEIAVTYDGTANAPIAPGSYAVVATSADDRYEGSASGTFVVDDPARSVRVPGGSLSALGDLTVPTFSIGAYEVTGSQWATVVTWAEANAGYDFAGAGVAASGDRPVTGISWFDAAKWCNARTEWENALLARSLAPAYQVAGAVYKTSTPTSPADLTCDFSAGGYRMPTASEWEYAARGGAVGTPSTYPGGNNLDELGWYTANSNGATQPAGGKSANGLGLYDLAGNAAEWTWDAPTGSPGRRLLQGGAWSSTPSACELTSLASETASLRLDRSGFRIVRSISLALAAALDAPDLAWESGGDEAWFAQTTPSHDGSDSAESGAVAPGQSSWLETTVTGPANLRFRWEASQRAALDVFRLETGTGEPILFIGAANWEERLVELPAGDHTLRWVFLRDAASTGTSRVRLDAVSVTPATTPTVTTAAAASISGSGATLGGNVTADGGRTVTARGVVYSTTPEPTLTSPGSLAAASGGTGAFSVVPAGLDEGTTYFARAYATNNLGTSYGENVVFTTDTTVPLTGGIGAVNGRALLAGDTQRFRFGLAFPSDAAFATTGLDAAIWELRDGGGALVDSGNGNVDFGGLLLSGQYLLTVTSSGGTTQTFSLDLDASVEAVPKPDLSIGSDPTAATGVGVYPPTAQSIAVLSRRGDPVTLFAKVANEGLLPDAMELRGSGGNSLFAVSYTTAGGNVTAAVIAGTFATEVMGPDDAAVGITVTVTPNKRLLTKKVKKGKRVLTTTLRKTHSGLIEATAADDPTRSDTVRYQVTTTP